MFKSGDKIKCIDATMSDGRLTVGKIYEVLYAEYSIPGDVQIICNLGYRCWWRERRFEKAQQSLEEIYNSYV
jgi:hypothetical protein